MIDVENEICMRLARRDVQRPKVNARQISTVVRFVFLDQERIGFLQSWGQKSFELPFRESHSEMSELLSITVAFSSSEHPRRMARETPSGIS